MQLSNIQLNNSNMDLLDILCPFSSSTTKNQYCIWWFVGWPEASLLLHTTVEKTLIPFQEEFYTAHQPNHQWIDTGIYAKNDGLLSVSFEILSKSSTELSFKTIISNESSQIIDGIAIKLAMLKQK